MLPPSLLRYQHEDNDKANYVTKPKIMLLAVQEKHQTYEVSN